MLSPPDESVGVAGSGCNESDALTTGVATIVDCGVPKVGVEGVAAPRGVAGKVADPLSTSWTPFSMV